MKKDSHYEYDDLDKVLFNIANKNKEPVPSHIHNTFIKTIENYYKEQDLKKYNKKTFKTNHSKVIIIPTKIIIWIIILILISTTFVSARQTSVKFFGKDNVRLSNIGISNEFIFTENLEQSLKQNIPTKLIPLDENYSLSIDSVLVDEINLFIVFSLHCRNKVTDDLRFSIRDLEIKDDQNNIICDYKTENIYNHIKGYNNIYNTENSIKELFFLFGNDNSNINKLNISFSQINIYKYNTQINTPNKAGDINIACDKKNIQIELNKTNFSTTQEYIIEETNGIKSDYTIEKVLFTQNGLYVIVNSPTNQFSIVMRNNNQIIRAEYQLYLNRTRNSQFKKLFVYNISNKPNEFTLYNNIDRSELKLIKK